MSPALTAKAPVTDPLFRFEEETHTYFLGERILPSITQILGEMGYVNAEHFTEEHRYRGQYVHWCIRLLNENALNRDDVDPQFRGYLAAYEAAQRDLGIKVLRCETPRYHPTLFYAGTPDIITEDDIWEIKTGEIYDWVALQTIAQDMLERPWETRPKRRKRYGLRLNKDGTYHKPVQFKNWLQDETVFKINVAAVLNKPLYGAPMLRGLSCKK